jgi:arsenate reductase (thioredoxin)
MTKRTVLFLCPHNAAKSVMAAAYFGRLANQNNLDFCAISAGTEPDDATAPAVIDLLQSEGFDVSTHLPRRVTREELVGAFRVVSLSCDVSDLAPPNKAIERWDNIPPASQNLMAARDAILEQVERLISELKQTRESSRDLMYD